MPSLKLSLILVASPAFAQNKLANEFRGGTGGYPSGLFILVLKARRKIAAAFVDDPAEGERRGNEALRRGSAKIRSIHEAGLGNRRN
jgi:hypothetical protein